MQNAVEGACAEAGSRDLVISGDESWQKRGSSSHHGVVVVISSPDAPKVIYLRSVLLRFIILYLLWVLDIERLSKRCTVCDGANSIKQSNPVKFEQMMSTHRWQLNYKGSSGKFFVLIFTF